MPALLDRILHGAEAHRAYFYRLATVLGPVLVAAHFITGGTLSTVLPIIGAVLGFGGTGLASANTSTSKTKTGLSIGSVTVDVKPKNEGGAVNLSGLVQVLIGVVLVLAILWFLGLHVRIG